MIYLSSAGSGGESTEVRLTREDIIRIVQEAELLRNILQNLQRQASIVSSLIREIEVTREVLRQVKTLNPDNEILVPLGATTYIRATIRDRERALIGIGANYMIEVPIEDVISILERRQKELEKNLESIQTNMTQVATRLSQIESLLERIRSELASRRETATATAT
ncbi:MAG: prefoldin subunit alpha [Thermoprotei archaeon]|nr:MAG: prefoldin subunit alpha [Thermoprotei archaeon]